MNIPLGPNAAPLAVSVRQRLGRQADALYLLTELRRRGYTVALLGEGLNLTPASKLTDGERAEIAEQKAELMTLLFEGA